MAGFTRRMYWSRKRGLQSRLLKTLADRCHAADDCAAAGGSEAIDTALLPLDRHQHQRWLPCAKTRIAAGPHKLSINDFIVKAYATALQRVPDANAIWTDEAIIRYRQSDVAVAVAVDGGLFTPVIRNAEAKSVAAISAE